MFYVDNPFFDVLVFIGWKGSQEAETVRGLYRKLNLMELFLEARFLRPPQH